MLRKCPYCFEKPVLKDEELKFFSHYQCESCGLMIINAKEVVRLSQAEYEGKKCYETLNEVYEKIWNDLVHDIKYGEDSFGPDEEEDE